MPETRMLSMALIVEPPEPMRLGFDEVKMEELIDSMRGIGQLQAIAVMPEYVAGEATLEKDAGEEHRAEPRATGRFEIKYGHRRFIAAQALGWKEIEAKIYQPGEADSDTIKAQENLIREDVTEVEIGNYCLTLKDKPGVTEERLRVMIGKPLSFIYRCMALCQGDEVIAAAVHRREITLAVATALNKISVEEDRRYYLRLAIDAGVTGKQAEVWVMNWKVQAGLRPPVAEPVATSPLPAPQPGYVLRCALCGGDNDPYNLESVYIHRAELAAIKAGIRAAETVAP